jgi:hypothetical protein
MRRRESASRRGPVRPPRYTVLVYCGGVRTEPDYFDGLKIAFRSANLTINHQMNPSTSVWRLVETIMEKS